VLEKIQLVKSPIAKSFRLRALFTLFAGAQLLAEAQSQSPPPKYLANTMAHTKPASSRASAVTIFAQSTSIFLCVPGV